MVKILRKIFILAVILNIVEISIPLIKKMAKDNKVKKQAVEGTKKTNLFTKLKTIVSNQNQEIAGMYNEGTLIHP